MAIKLVVSNTVGLKVKGVLNDERGKPQPFDFHLTCERLNQEEMRDVLREGSDRMVDEFLVDVVQGWSGVKDEDGKDVPFSAEAFKQLLNIKGMDAIIFSAYSFESGAKPKN